MHIRWRAGQRWRPFVVFLLMAGMFCAYLLIRSVCADARNVLTMHTPPAYVTFASTKGFGSNG